jgi:hypothetical protein
MPFDSFLGAYVKRDMNRSSGQMAKTDELKQYVTMAEKMKASEMHAWTEISHTMKKWTLKFAFKQLFQKLADISDTFKYASFFQS